MSIKHYVYLHVRSAKDALVKIIRQPFSSLLSLATLSLALLLPLMLYAVIASVQDYAPHMAASPQMTLFMDLSADDVALGSVHQQLKQDHLVARYLFISKDQALAELASHDDMSGLTDVLPDNPLPDVFVVTPTATDLQSLSSLQKTLSHLPGVHQVQFDMRWAQRFYELIKLGHRAVLLFGLVFGAAVVLITYNIIYMQILGKKEEIVVSKLIGASDHFIRRAFFYHACWQALLAALIAWLGTLWVVGAVNPVIHHFASLYHEKILLRPLHFDELTLFTLLTVVLAVVGARLAVGQHLRQLKAN